MCYDHLFHSGGNYHSGRFSGLLAATGLVNKELSSNLALVAPLLCSLHHCIYMLLEKRLPQVLDYPQ